jgi:hypothetical protein
MLRAMKTAPTFAALVAVIGLFLAAVPACAESIASSASSAGSESVGSLSDSVGASSDSSTGNRVAAGAYRVVAAAPAIDGRQRLTLQAVQDARRTFELRLPVQADLLQTGDLVEVQERPYGLAFARAQATEPFFIALADAWRGELGLRPVPL